VTEHSRQLIEAAARERFNDGAAQVMRAAFQAIESDQKTLAEIRSGTFLSCQVFSLLLFGYQASTTAANISTHLEDDHALKSGVVLNTRKPKDIALVKAYLDMLAFVDNPTPAGKAASFVSFTGSKVYVEFEIIAMRLRRRVLEAVTRERHGDEGVRVLRLLLDCGKADEKQVCVYLA
jgi:DNA-directed RNA polymerase III subunit RPC3